MYKTRLFQDGELITVTDTAQPLQPKTFIRTSKGTFRIKGISETVYVHGIEEADAVVEPISETVVTPVHYVPPSAFIRHQPRRKTAPIRSEQ